MAIEIVDLPINSMVIFHSNVNVYQRIKSPEQMMPAAQQLTEKPWRQTIHLWASSARTLRFARAIWKSAKPAGWEWNLLVQLDSLDATSNKCELSKNFGFERYVFSLVLFEATWGKQSIVIQTRQKVRWTARMKLVELPKMRPGKSCEISIIPDWLGV